MTDAFERQDQDITPLERPALDAAARQYQTYVEKAEALVERRAEVNRFYLTLNTAILSAIGFLMPSGPFIIAQNTGFESLAFYLPALAVVGFVISWIWRNILLSQRLIMRRKFDVLHIVEKSLPIAPYTIEWEMSEKRRKNSFSKFELRLPLVFMALYIVGFAFLVTTAVTQNWAFLAGILEG